MTSTKSNTFKENVRGWIFMITKEIYRNICILIASFEPIANNKYN